MAVVFKNIAFTGDAPTAHTLGSHTTHSSVKLDDLGTPDNNTDLDFSTARHGLVPKGTNTGDFLKDDGTWATAGAGGPTLVRKTADEVINNNNSFQNDDHLLLAIGANEVWQIEVFIIYESDTNPDIKFQFAYPTGCLIKWGASGSGKVLSSASWGDTPTSSSDILKREITDLSQGAPSAGNIAGLRLSLIVTNGANAGNVNLQWAQFNAVGVNTTVFENSCLIAHQLL